MAPRQAPGEAGGGGLSPARANQTTGENDAVVIDLNVLSLLKINLRN